MGIILNAKCYVFRILMDWEIMGDRKRDKAAPKKKLKKKKEQKWERNETTKMDQFLLIK